jgi:YVTN family beta-propeller protein
MKNLTALLAILTAATPCAAAPPRVSESLTPTLQVLKPAGQAVTFSGRPVDLSVAPDGRHVFVKDNRGLVVIERKTWKVIQELPVKETGGSMHGIAVSRDGKRLFLSTAHNNLYEGAIGPDGKVRWARTISLPGRGPKGAAHATGLALAPDEKTLYVCLSLNNSLGVVDLHAGKLVKEIAVGVAPYALLLAPDGNTAYVSNWGGRHPRDKKARTAASSGTKVLVDERGVANSGTVGKVDLQKRQQIAAVGTGLHPAGLALHAPGKRLFVANANSDTISVIDTQTFRKIEDVLVRPDRGLHFGSAPNAVAVTADGKTLYVACAGNNAVAVISLCTGPKSRARVEGFIPTAWYPGAVALHGRQLFVANVKGLGSRADRGEKRSVLSYLGVVSKVPLPRKARLAELSAQVNKDARVPQMLLAWERGGKGIKPVPVPKRVGELSVFEHVVYVIKENRTYDQVFGDIKESDGDPKLCIFGEKFTPNHHALAREFVLLDNFYCNGVVSTDGHAWATEGFVSGYLEKAFGGSFTRGYVWGDDPLSYSSSGFVWDHVLLHGLSFRNYGEFDHAKTIPEKATFTDVLRDFRRKGKKKVAITQSVGIEPLRRYTCPDYPGWNMNIPDVLRADAFLRELRRFEKEGHWPNLVIVYLPQDHTSGTTAGMPTPAAHVADNDSALGRIVEAITRCRFWPKTCIFVTEDDPQDGFDHVDGHRSPCLVVSPYTRRRAVVHDFYNQTSVLHTLLRMLGCPPMNQSVAAAPLMTACFTDKPNLKHYKARKANVPLGQLNPKKAGLRGRALHWAARSAALDWSKPDAADEDTLNRILWHAMRGRDADYPVHLAGAHGNGLAARRLRHARIKE